MARTHLRLQRPCRRPDVDRELLLHEEAVGDNRSCATESQKLGEGSQPMRQKDVQVSHGEGRNNHRQAQR